MDKRATPSTSKRSDSAGNSRDCFCDESSEGSNCSSSYDSDSDSSAPEWESLVTTSGELLYIDCDPTVYQKSSQPEPENTDVLTKTSVRKSTRNKFLKLLHRRDSKRKSKRVSKTHDAQPALQDTARVKFQDHDEGEIREVFLKLNHPDNRQLGRRATLIESLLGLSVSTLLDGSRVMIAGFIPDSEAAKQSGIKIGDWLRSINNVDVSFQNLNSILEKMSLGNEVVLKLQRVAGIEVTKNPPINELTNNSQFVQQILDRSVDESLNEFLCKFQVGILYFNTDRSNEAGFGDCVSYSYPSPFETNVLYLTKGVFITLNHLLSSITQSEPSLSSAIVNGQLVHIAHQRFNKNILYFMLPDKYASNVETTIMLRAIVCILKFIYPAIDKCFENSLYKESLDKLFASIFTKIICGESFSTLSGWDDILHGKWKFEKFLPVVNRIALHEEAQIQIEDSLNELEASDYREWNEEPLDCRRLFTVLGSALFHSGCLLGSHLVHEDLIDISLFCRYYGLFYVSQVEPIRSLVLWREVYPFSCNRDHSENTQFVAPDGKRFLLIVGKGKELLTVLMEAGGCTEPVEENIHPDAFYVEEVQATLEHLYDLRIPHIAEHFISHSGWKIVPPEIPLKRRSDFLINMPFVKSTSSPVPKDVTTSSKKKPEVTSILKHRSPDRTRFSSSSLSLHDDGSENQSEDSMSCSSFSETSEEPVGGRVANVEKKNVESDEDSDVEDNSSIDLTDMKQSLSAETAEMESARLTAGVQNVLFYFVNLDMTDGVLICPPKFESRSPTLENVLSCFRACALQIHNTFQNTLRYKNMLANDLSKFVTNKSLVAITEQGMLFECGYNCEEGAKKFEKLTYWVVGRLFYTPHPREIFICYQDAISQNVMEIAFKLNASNG